MHLNPHLAVDPSWVGWMFLFAIIALILAVISGITCLFFIFDVDQEQEDFDVHRVRVNTFLGATVGVLGAAALLTGAIIGLNTNNDRWYSALQQQAQQRYGLELNRSQLNELLYVTGTDAVEQGNTLAILGNKDGAATAETVTLFHVGNTWLLGTGSSYTSAQEINQILR